jgi:hypothetical protein
LISDEFRMVGVSDFCRRMNSSQRMDITRYINRNSARHKPIHSHAP